jgi:predicted Zn-dependent peptidase
MITLPKLPEVHIGKLSNGMRYVFVPDKGNGLIYAKMLGYAGSILENDPRVYGIAHCLEHVACKGTKSFPDKEVLTNEFDVIGAYRNASTGFTQKNYWIKTSNTKKREAIRYVSECVLFPVLDQSVIDAEKNIVQSELRDYLSKAIEREQINFRKAAYNDPRTEVHIIGLNDSIENITRQDLVNFHKQFYSLSNFVIGVTGDISHEEVISVLEDEIGNVPCDNPPTEKIWMRSTGTGRTVVTDSSIKNSSIDIHWGIEKQDFLENYPKLKVATFLLGSMRRSRLHRTLREKMAMVYGVHMSTSGYSSFSSDMSISTSTEKKNVDLVIEATLGCVKNFLKEGPTDIELEQVFNQLLFGIKNFILNKESVLSNVMSEVLYNSNFILLEDEFRKGLSVKKDEMMETFSSVAINDPFIFITNPE